MDDRARTRASAYRFRLGFGFALVIAILAAAWIWSLFGPLATMITEQQERHLGGVARTAAAVLDTGPDSLGARVNRIADDTGLRLTVVAADGAVLADSEEPTASLENHGDRPEIREALAGRTGVWTRLSETQGVERLYVAVPAALDGETVAVRVSATLESVDAAISRPREIGFLVLAAALAAATLVISRLTRAVAEPVESLADTAVAMAAGNLAAPVPKVSGPLEPLAEALTCLRDQLHERVADLESGRRALQLALDGLTDGVLVVDGDEVGFANRAILAALPGPLDPVGRTLDRLALPTSIITAIRERIQAGQTGSVDIGPDPFDRYARITAVPLGSGVHGTRTLVVIQDQTEPQRLGAVRRDFVANASHELKTPAASILLLSETAQDAAADGDETAVLGFVGQIHDEAARLRRLVADLLDLSRLETTPDPSAVTDVRRAIEVALAAHRRAATARGLRLEARLDAVSGEDVAVRADPTDLAIALDNLLDNAIAYTESGQVTVAVSADGEWCRIAVRDTGIGIPAEDLDRIFERFYRVDRARSRTSGGTGLGLALVKHAVERSGGDVSIASAPGSGTVVTVSLLRAR